MSITQEQHQDIEKRVKDIVAGQFRVTTPYLGDPNTRFVEDLGAELDDMIKLFTKIEDNFSKGDDNFSISDQEEQEIRTISDLINLVINKKQQQPTE